MAQRQRILYAFQTYGKRLLNFIRSRVANEQEAEDILQDVWYQLLSLIDTQPVEQLSAWLYRVSMNKIIDRSRRQNFLLFDDLVNDKGDSTFPEAFPAALSNPELELDKSIFQEALLQVISELPEKQRQVFIWNEFDGLSLQEIADQTGTNLKTIISRKRYAVTQLKKRLNHFK